MNTYRALHGILYILARSADISSMKRKSVLSTFAATRATGGRAAAARIRAAAAAHAVAGVTSFASFAALLWSSGDHPPDGAATTAPPRSFDFSFSSFCYLFVHGTSPAVFIPFTFYCYLCWSFCGTDSWPAGRASTGDEGRSSLLERAIDSVITVDHTAAAAAAAYTRSRPGRSDSYRSTATSWPSRHRRC